MSKWLASVQSVEDVQILLPVLPDILDMKDPSKGALGALSVEVVTEIVNMVDGRCLTSATIGDLPMKADVINDAMMTMAGSGVDYVKIGLFPTASLTSCVEQLEHGIKNLKTPVIGVLFADKNIDLDLIEELKHSGFKGVMIDTAIKNGQGLLDHWNLLTVKSFVSVVQDHDMICGLAGALRVDDIEILKPLNADYLGFRSALCQQHKRTSRLSLTCVEQVSRKFQGE